MNKKLTMALACIMGATALRASTVLWDPFTLEKIVDDDLTYYHLSAHYTRLKGQDTYLYSDLFFWLDDSSFCLRAILSDDRLIWFGENWVKTPKNYVAVAASTRNQKEYFYHIGMDEQDADPSSDYSITPTWDNAEECYMAYLACALAFVNFDDYNESYYEPLVTPIYGWVTLKIDNWSNDVELVHSALDIDGDYILRSYVPPPPPTPEPASGALLLSGCLLLCARRRRRAAVKCCQCGNVASSQ